MTFYETLVEQTATQRQQLYSVPQLSNGLIGSITRETYLAYLTEAFHHVKHTVKFLMAMGLYLPASKQYYQKAIAEYISEEVGHEEWILNDIEAAGGDKELARNSTPMLETQVLVAYNYDYIQRKNPMGFFGMVFMLESTSMQLASQSAKAIKERLKLSNNAFSYLSSHGALDIDHMKFFEKTVNNIDNVEDRRAIIDVAQNTFRLFANLLSAIPVSEVENNAA
ncbi:MAG: long-chain acyl-CoA synthetase [Cellvibrionaceae bacterium]|jgi:long-chain acyl-CoA synthetase